MSDDDNTSSTLLGNTIKAEITAEQNELTAQFQRRGLNVLPPLGDKTECTPGANDLHWSFIDPRIGTDTSYSYFGITQTTLEIYWHLTLCPIDNASPQTLLSVYDAYSQQPSNPPPYMPNNSRVFNSTKAYDLQVRAPTDFLASIFGILTLVHPAGHALVAASVTAGISAVSGSLNTLLNSAYKEHDLTQAAILQAAWTIANQYCVRWTNCLRVSRP